MSDNIGTITVAIEAQTADLQAGLQKAEKAVKDAAQKMETQTESLAQRAEKSWTEFASKLGVIQQAAQIASQAMTVLTDATLILGDESASAADKYASILDSIATSGIPVLSQAVQIGTQIRGLLDGSLAELKEINKEIERLAKLQKLLDRQLESAKGLRTMKDSLELMKQQTQQMRVQASGDSWDKLKQKEVDLNNERVRLAEDLATKVHNTDRKRREDARETADAVLAEFDRQARIQMDFANAAYKEEARLNGEREVALAQRLQKERDAEKAKLDAIAERERKEIESERKRLAAIQERAAAEAQAIRRSTEDLQTQLAVMQAEAAGNELQAQLISIEAQFRRMREGATEEQLALIHQIEAETVAKAQRSQAEAETAPDEDEGGGGTATISTAIGSFTVAAASEAGNQRKQQIGLLEQIAENTKEIEITQTVERTPVIEKQIVEQTSVIEKQTVERTSVIVEKTKRAAESETYKSSDDERLILLKIAENTKRAEDGFIKANKQDGNHQSGVGHFEAHLASQSIAQRKQQIGLLETIAKNTKDTEKNTKKATSGEIIIVAA